MKIERNNIVCKDYNCYSNENVFKCLRCKKGKVIVVCPNCNKEHIITCQFMRIDCSCGGGFLHCYELSEFVNKKLIKEKKK